MKKKAAKILRVQRWMAMKAQIILFYMLWSDMGSGIQSLRINTETEHLSAHEGMSVSQAIKQSGNVRNSSCW